MHGMGWDPKNEARYHTNLGMGHELEWGCDQQQKGGGNIASLVLCIVHSVKIIFLW